MLRLVFAMIIMILDIALDDIYSQRVLVFAMMMLNNHGLYLMYGWQTLFFTITDPFCALSQHQNIQKLCCSLFWALMWLKCEVCLLSNLRKKFLPQNMLADASSFSSSDALLSQDVQFYSLSSRWRQGLLTKTFQWHLLALNREIHK